LGHRRHTSSSARAGVDALKEAIRIRYNCSDFTFSHELAGCTDSHIIKNSIIDIKGSCNASDAAGLLILYYRLLPNFCNPTKAVFCQM
jgi:hypothetical protein